MKLQILAIFLLTINLNSVICAKLEMVQMIWRHGDRAPKQLPYPKDMYGEKRWPRGWNQLTNKGIEQARNLGIFFRNYYKSSGLLQEFNKDQIHILSSESERAINTAQAFLAGCFPPNGEFVWDSSTLKSWQPTPFHTTGPGPDPLLRGTKIKCPNYEKIEAQEEIHVAARINKEYAELFEMLENYTGILKIDYENVKDLYNIQREIYHKMEQPKWVNQIWNKKPVIEHLKELKRISRIQKFNSPQKSKFRGGFLVNKFIQNMLDFKSGASKISQYLYSSHDGTLSALGYALNISDHQLVPYVATYIIELYDDNTVQVLYRNSDANPNSLIIPGCSKFCPLDKFVKLFENVRVKTLSELYSICGTKL